MAKVSDITIDDIKSYAKIEYDDDDSMLQIILDAVKSYIRGHTGLTDEVIDTKEDITIALFILVNEMYENRQYTIQSSNINPVISQILNMHSINLL